nr:APC family permease [uncultured Actinoplanes sp.]
MHPPEEFLVPSTPTTSAVSNALARNRVGTFGISMSIASSVAPLTVVAGLVTTALAVTGLSGVSIAMIAIAVVLLIFVVGYMAMARHIENAGAFYAYIARGIGRPAGVGASWIALLAYDAFQIASMGGLGVIGAPLIKDWFGIDVHWFVIAAVAWVIVAVLGVRDVGVSEKVLIVLVLAETGLVLLYSVIIVATNGFHFSSAALSPHNLWGPGAGALLVIAATAFAGVEQGAVYIEESREPRRTVPRATYGTIILIAAVYFFASWVQISAGGAQVIDRAGQEGPDLFFNEAAVSMGDIALDLGHGLFLTSLVATTIAFHNIIARYTFALGREGVLPRLFGRTTAQGAPRNASVAQSAIAIAALGLWAIAGWDPLTTLFFWGGTSGGLGILLLLTLTSAAVIGYFWRNHHGESAWHRIGAPVIATVLLLGISYLAVTNLSSLYGVAPRSGPAIVVPIVYAIVFLGGIGWGLALKASKPAVYAGIGQGTRSNAAGISELSALLDEPSGVAGR